MKHSIKLSALFLFISTGLFAATGNKTTATTDDVTVQSSGKPLVVDLSIRKEGVSKSYVTFYDNESNEIMTDYLPSKQSVNKGYNLSELKYGTYTMAITSNHQVIKKQVAVFEEYGKKTYMFLQ